MYEYQHRVSALTEDFARTLVRWDSDPVRGLFQTCLGDELPLLTVFKFLRSLVVTSDLLPPPPPMFCIPFNQQESGFNTVLLVAVSVLFACSTCATLTYCDDTATLSVCDDV